ncbi:unnamed protein product [Echinostoma caproni]|uniref:TSNAXIP1_N domain-containing protein n=1 Tax=Echinostoma caproni TaxID=27848 RepID=A0A183AMF4_9TREM|nr:unnamed protein product [Echinostoma caproni]
MSEERSVIAKIQEAQASLVEYGYKRRGGIPADLQKLPPVKKPRFLEILEARINKEKAKFRVVEGKPDPLRLQIYREIFTIFIQTCVYYGPLLARIKAEYESYLVYVQDQLKKLQPIRVSSFEVFDLE